MNNWSDYERFLKPVHLEGKAVTLTIVKATEEETHPQKGKTTTSPVLWFREKPFGLILSPTNRATLIALYGDAIAGCIGKPITVQAVSVKVAGNDKQPIRILKQRPAAPSIEPATGEIVPPSWVVPPQGATPEAVYEQAHGPEWVGNLGEAPGELDAHFGGPKLTATTAQTSPDFCTRHSVVMTETSPKTGLPFHRITEDSKVGFCNGVETKFGNGHAAGGK
jgi:hypothetical protein